MLKSLANFTYRLYLTKKNKIFILALLQPIVLFSSFFAKYSIFVFANFMLCLILTHFFISTINSAEERSFRAFISQNKFFSQNHLWRISNNHISLYFLAFSVILLIIFLPNLVVIFFANRQVFWLEISLFLLYPFILYKQRQILD
jgi:hypothetical protein